MSRIEKTQGQYNFTEYDTMLTLAEKFDLRLYSRTEQSATNTGVFTNTASLTAFEIVVENDCCTGQSIMEINSTTGAIRHLLRYPSNLQRLRDVR